ncbi:Arb2 domain-containing protein [Halteromyces radiatus]|uniref:Arb2 domain-containing protein n=1 Tax=Halteromyces radiatus TaxID=101107 RepID=UPI00221F87D4|nr:Arb2 domain-containing protein [Halteromyces radiatus]KAI8084660.1 Arb2 domain-containing protein [Halteromyces radiatus]
MYRGKKKQREVKDPIPTTLDEFGYVLKDNGAVRSKTTDLLGDEVESRLKQAPYHFQSVTIPLEADPAKNDPHTFFYMTPNALTTTGKLLLLIPGTGTRIGQWSRRVLSEESIQAGSMLNMVNKAKEYDYEVIIFNPNTILWYDNAPQYLSPLQSSKTWSSIPGNESPENHCQYVFRHFVSQTQAEKIGIIGLGWAGHCFTELLNEHFDIFKSKVVGVALANSNHSSRLIHGDDKRAWLDDHTVNWNLNSNEIAESVFDAEFGCKCINSDAELPDYVLWQCTDDMMKFICTKMGDMEQEAEENQVMIV